MYLLEFMHIHVFYSFIVSTNSLLQGNGFLRLLAFLSRKDNLVKVYMHIEQNFLFTSLLMNCRV